MVEANVRAVKLSSPDYKGWDPARAMQDYLSRIRAQEQLYETIEQPSFPCASRRRGSSADHADVKIINGGDRIVINNVFGYLQSRIVFFLMVRLRAIARVLSPQNIHHRYRTIWFARVRPRPFDGTDKPVGPVRDRALVQGRLVAVRRGR